MKITTVLATTAAAAGIGVLSAPIALADNPTPNLVTLGQPAELINGSVVQAWTISGLKPSSDVIPWHVRGALWEATATNTAVAGTVQPIVSDLNARARNGDTYRTLFLVATPQGVNPAALAQGQQTSGKIYFDVTGAQPDSVVPQAAALNPISGARPMASAALMTIECSAKRNGVLVSSRAK